jgi:predicted dehydrogenase
LIDRLLIVGHGSIGKRHLRIARELLPNADIRVLRHQKCEAIPPHANGCMSSLRDALIFAPQAAVIATPSTFHTQMAQPLADAGVHLLVEKPLAACLDGVRRLVSSCEAHGNVLMTAYNLRFFPSLQVYREKVRSGFIGKVFSVRCEIGQYLPSWRPDSDYRGGVSASRALGGGALLELSHEIDYLRWIFGEVAWVKASLSRQSNLDIDVDDTAHLILGFVPDMKGRNLIANLNMDLVRHDATRQCVAIGEHGSLRWNGLTGIVEIFPAGGTAWDRVFEHKTLRDESYIAEWRHFLACIQDDVLPLISGRDGLATLNIIEAARRSAAFNHTSLIAVESDQ